MKIQDMNSVCEVTTEDAIQAALGKRYGGGRNAFWISLEGRKYPALVVMVIDKYANAHFLSEEDNAGYQAVGGDLGLNPLEKTAFFMSTDNEPEQVDNTFVISAQSAIEAVKEFAQTAQLPSVLRWIAL